METIVCSRSGKWLCLCLCRNMCSAGFRSSLHPLTNTETHLCHHKNLLRIKKEKVNYSSAYTDATDNAFYAKEHEQSKPLIFKERKERKNPNSVPNFKKRNH